MDTQGLPGLCPQGSCPHWRPALGLSLSPEPSKGGIQTSAWDLPGPQDRGMRALLRSPVPCRSPGLGRPLPGDAIYWSQRLDTLPRPPPAAPQVTRLLFLDISLPLAGSSPWQAGGGEDRNTDEAERCIQHHTVKPWRGKRGNVPCPSQLLPAARRWHVLDSLLPRGNRRDEAGVWELAGAGRRPWPCADTLRVQLGWCVPWGAGLMGGLGGLGSLLPPFPTSPHSPEDGTPGASLTTVPGPAAAP